MTTLLGICGSLRAASTNLKLLREAARVFAPDRFIEADIRFPLFDADLEAEGIPEPVQTLAGQIAEADAIVIATPEYNKAPPGVLKNALDWVSRTDSFPWTGKPLAIVSAADGRAGGERSQFALRLMLVPFRPLILQGPEVFIGSSGAAFDDAGRLKDERSVKFLTGLMDEMRALV